MKRNLLACLLCIAMLASLLTACGKSSGTVNLPISASVTSLDPQICADDDAGSIINNCFEGLVRIDADGKVQPAAADHWTVSDDGLTYTFHLRTDGAWHLYGTTSSLMELLGEDYQKNFSTTVTAEDFVFGLQRALDPDTKSPGAAALFCIQNAESVYDGTMEPSDLGVNAENDTTLVITLSEPDVNFLTALAKPAAMPCSKAFFKATAGRYGLSASLLLSNGPYYVSSMSTSSTDIVLTKNSSYKGDFKGKMGSAAFVVASDSSDTASSDTTETTTEASSDSESSSGSVDIMTSLQASKNGLDAAQINPSDASSLSGKFNIRLYANAVKSLCFNQKSAFSKNYNLRQAIIYATDPSTLSGIGSSDAVGILPDCVKSAGSQSYRSAAGNASIPEYSMDQAETYYKAAASSSGSSTSYSIKLLCLDSDRTAVQAMIQNWQKVFGTNLSISIKSYPTQTELNTALSGGSYDIALTSLKASDFIAPIALQQFLSTSSTNFVNFSDSTFDSYVSAAGHAASADVVSKNCLLAENRLISQGCILPLRAENSCVAIKKSVKGLYLTPAGTTWAVYGIGQKN